MPILWHNKTTATKHAASLGGRFAIHVGESLEAWAPVVEMVPPVVAAPPLAVGGCEGGEGPRGAPRSLVRVLAHAVIGRRGRVGVGQSQTSDNQTSDVKVIEARHIYTAQRKCWAGCGLKYLIQRSVG